MNFPAGGQRSIPKMTSLQQPWLVHSVWLVAVLFCLTTYASPGLALALGLGLVLILGNPYPRIEKKVSKPLLQGSVILLGFGMNLYGILATARQGFLLAALTIGLTFLLGGLLQRILRLPRSTATLVSAGTAICGGSAIAAVSLAIAATETEISIAMGTVFLLNAVALYLFPLLGHTLGLTPVQFGTWSGIAMHDVSSVVGAASTFGQQALETATTVKLARTLWIIPVALIAGLIMRSPVEQSGVVQSRKIHIPWFIGLFLLASIASTFMAPVHKITPALLIIAKTGMTLTLFFIGTSLSWAALKKVGYKPVLLGLILWLVISLVSLIILRFFPA